MTATEGGPGLRVVDNPREHRFEAYLGDRLAGFAVYRAQPGRLVFTHTETLPEFAGRGVGSGLAAAALDEVRARGLAVVPRCPFIAAWIERHPEYRDLVAGTGS
jgi:predicted GNAT family acetyltransferase